MTEQPSTPSLSFRNSANYVVALLSHDYCRTYWDSFLFQLITVVFVFEMIEIRVPLAKLPVAETEPQTQPVVLVISVGLVFSSGTATNAADKLFTHHCMFANFPWQ